MLHTQNHDLLCCDKGEEQKKKKAAKWSAGFFPFGLHLALKKEKEDTSEDTEPSYLQTNPGRNAIRCSFCDQVLLSEAFFSPTDELCSL